MKGELMEFIKYYKKYIIGGLGILLVFSAAFYFYFKEEKSVTSIKNDDLLLSDNSNLTKEQNLEDKENIIYVDVKGAVKKPGVYELTTNDKIIDAINKVRPAAVKGQYLKSVTLTSTMGPGVKINPMKLV